MFDTLGELENGKDPLTQLLNRRFIPTIMRHEISLALNVRKPFILAMLVLITVRESTTAPGTARAIRRSKQ